MAKGRRIGFNYSNRDDNYEDYYNPRSYNRGGNSYSGNSYSNRYSGGGGSYYNWSWGSFGSYGAIDEDDDKLYIKANEGYFTPKAADVQIELEKLNVPRTQNNVDLVKEMARFFYFKLLDDKDYFEEKFKDLESLTEAEVENFSIKKQYYDDLWDKFIPGITPLEKALAAVASIQQNKPDALKGGDKVTMKDAVRELDFHEEIYEDPEYNELMDMKPQAKKSKIKILGMISMIKNLGSEFKVQKDVEEKIVDNSSIISKKVMRDYSQLHNVELYQRLMPTFSLKLLTKDLIVNVPVEKTEHKQKIIILLDFSGSMNQTDKQEWVLAILIDRLKYVMKEEAEIFFSYFVHEPDEMNFHHLKNKEDVLAFWKKFSTNPNGGDTYLGAMVNKINDEINTHKRLMNLKVDLSEDKPEILAINDGQDSVKTNGFTYKTNAITLIDGANSELRKLCVANRGKYVYVNRHSIETTSVSGTENIAMKK